MTLPVVRSLHHTNRNPVPVSSRCPRPCPQPLTTTVRCRSPRICLLWTAHSDGSIRTCPFCVWLRSLSIVLHPHCSVCQCLTPFPSSLLFGRTAFCVCAHLLMDIWVALIGGMTGAAVNTRAPASESLLSLLGGTHRGVKLLGHVLILCLTF